MFQASELQPFFVVDTCICTSEYDDPKDAIVYFHPAGSSENYQCTLCCQLMGVVEFYGSSFSMPKILSLEEGKFAIRKCEQKYLLCLGSGLSDTPDNLLSECLDFILQTFTFYNGSISSACRQYRDVGSIWSGCLAAAAATTCDGGPGPIFAVLPWLRVSERSDLYLRASHIVKSCIVYPWYLAGSIFHKRRLVFTELEPCLSAFLSVLKRHPSVARTVSVAKDVLFTNVYLGHSKFVTLGRHSTRSGDEGSEGQVAPQAASTSDDYESPLADSAKSSSDTLDSCNGSSEFHDYGGFSDSLENSLKLIHRVTFDSLEKLNSTLVGGAPRRRHRKKLQESIKKQKTSTCNQKCPGLTDLQKQKRRISLDVIKRDEMSYDSSFFESSPCQLETFPLIPTKDLWISTGLCKNFGSSLRLGKTSEAKIVNIDFVPMENDFKSENEVRQTRSSTFSSSDAFESLNSSGELESPLKPVGTLKSGVEGFQSSFKDTDDSEVFKVGLYIFRQGETDLYLLMDDGATNSPEMINSISKAIEKPLKKLDQLLVSNVHADVETATGSTVAFSVDNFWRTFSGNFRSTVPTWGQMKEDFALDPTTKCLTVMNLKGTTYAHSSVTHEVFHSIWDADSYSPGVLDSQSSLCKMSTFPKRTFNKLGYFLLK